MPRFRDEWVIDRVLFDYVSGGTCACCGFQHFLPGSSTADLIGAVTDLESDDVRNEVQALEFHPWPIDLRDTVWAGRVKLRQKMKLSMKQYAAFWNQHGDELAIWCQKNPKILQRVFQLPRSEILEVVNKKFGIHSAYAVVLCAVAEQVAFFGDTNYEPDAKGEAELGFEKILLFRKMAGYTINILDSNDKVQADVLESWLLRMRTLGGPKLLERGSKNPDDDVEEPERGAFKSSFQSDRRIIRLLIARYWADVLMKRFLEQISPPREIDELTLET